MKKTLLSNQELIVSIASGDVSAFKILFDQYYPVLVKVLLRYSSEESEINSWIQDIYVRLWESRNNLADISVEDFKAYFILTARNYAINKTSKKVRVYDTSMLTSHTYMVANSSINNASDSLALMRNYCHAVERDLVNTRKSDILNQDLGVIYSTIATRLTLLVKSMETRISDAISLLRQELVLFRR